MREPKQPSKKHELQRRAVLKRQLYEELDQMAEDIDTHFATQNAQQGPKSARGGVQTNPDEVSHV